jgi:hypothetical protein
MHGWYVWTLALTVFLLGGCAGPKVDLTYPTGADDLVIQANSTGGLVPDAYIQSHIPAFRLWGDGRVIGTEWKDGQASVWEGHLTAEEIAALLEWIADKGFFRMDNHYTVKNPPLDLPTDSVRVNLVSGEKTVGEYYDGAPRAFGEIYGRLRAGAGASDVHPYQPGIGWVIVEPITWDTTREPVPWPDSLTPVPSEMGEGIWVEGDLLAFLWQGRLEQGPWMVYEVGGEPYGLVLQVPGLMPAAPEAP